MTAGGLGAEAFWALTQSCTWAVVGPVGLAALFWGGRLSFAASAWLGVWVGASARFSGALPATEYVLTGVVMVVAAGLGLWLARSRSGTPASVVAGIAVGIAVGVAASMSWQPCVGTDFGVVLTDWDDNRVRSVIALGWYLVPVFTPLWAFTGLAAVARHSRSSR